MDMRPEDLTGYICGINPAFEVMVIGVFVRENAARLLGPEGSHLVHSANNFDMPGLKREADVVWNLTEMFDVPRDQINSPEVAGQILRLKQRAAELKAAAEKKAAARQK